MASSYESCPVFAKIIFNYEECVFHLCVPMPITVQVFATLVPIFAYSKVTNYLSLVYSQGKLEKSGIHSKR